MGPVVRVEVGFFEGDIFGAEVEGRAVVEAGRCWEARKEGRGAREVEVGMRLAGEWEDVEGW